LIITLPGIWDRLRRRVLFSTASVSTTEKASAIILSPGSAQGEHGHSFQIGILQKMQRAVLQLALLAVVAAVPRNHQRVQRAFTLAPIRVVPPPSYGREDVRNQLDMDLLLEENEGIELGSAPAPVRAHPANTTALSHPGPGDPHKKRKYPLHPCAPKSASVWSLVRLLDSANFTCADEVMSRLSPRLAGSQLQHLMRQTNQAKRMRTRWNAIFALGKLCWAGPKICAKNTKALPISDLVKIKAMHALLKRHMSKFQDTLQTSILNEHTSGILKSAINVGRNGNWLATMSHQKALRKKLHTVASDSRIDAQTRFLAIQAWSDVAVGKWLPGDLTFLTLCLNHWDRYVRRDCSFTVKKVYKKLQRHMKKVVKGKLIEALGGENDLLTRANLASAFDHTVSVDTGVNKTEGSLTRRLRLMVQKRDLAHRYVGANINIRSSLSQHSANCWGKLVAWEKATYHNLFPGGTLSGKALPTVVNVFVFPTPAKYDEYMSAFISDGVGAGGFFYEAQDTLYTYQRTPDRYYISVEELILHELTHYFNKYELFHNNFGSVATKKEPDTWLNEGLAEFMGGLNFNDAGCFTTPLRGNYMRRICHGDISKWHLKTLLAAAEGSSTFDYQQGYSFVYYLATKQQRAFRSIIHSFRSGSYQRSAWKKRTGFSMGRLEQLWKAEVGNWCNSTDWKHLPVSYYEDKQVPICIPGAARARGCGIVGHGTRRMKESMMLNLNFSFTGPGGFEEL